MKSLTKSGLLQAAKHAQDKGRALLSISENLRNLAKTMTRSLDYSKAPVIPRRRSGPTVRSLIAQVLKAHKSNPLLLKELKNEVCLLNPNVNDHSISPVFYRRFVGDNIVRKTKDKRYSLR